MSPKMRRLTPEQVIEILIRNGFVKVHQKGSHQKWKNLVTYKQVIVAYHKGKPVPIGTLKAILSGSGLPAEEFE